MRIEGEEVPTGRRELVPPTSLARSRSLSPSTAQGQLSRKRSEHSPSTVAGADRLSGIDRVVAQLEDERAHIEREKRLKKWNRAWKIQLIEEKNPNWDDLLPTLLGEPTP